MIFFGCNYSSDEKINSKWISPYGRNDTKKSLQKFDKFYHYIYNSV